MRQTQKTVIDYISKLLKVRLKYSPARRIFNSLLGVWECGQRRSFVFAILPQSQTKSLAKQQLNRT